MSGIAAAVKAEREACARMADAWSKRFDTLAEAGGNDVIDERAARQLRRYFAGFADELRAEMHLPDMPASEAVAHG